MDGYKKAKTGAVPSRNEAKVGKRTVSDIQDRLGNSLKKAETKPTVMQAVNSWDLLNELIRLGYPQNFQQERPDLVKYLNRLSGLIDMAYQIKSEGK